MKTETTTELIARLCQETKQRQAEKGKELLVTFEWKGQKFTSQDRLNYLAFKKIITMQIVGCKSENGYVFGYTYEFKTKKGEFIARFYKDSTFGFCTQATGVILSNVLNIYENEN